MGESESSQPRYRRILQQSVQTRMRAIQEKISLASTFCNTAEIAVRFNSRDRANYLLDKFRSTVEALEAHINNPGHVCGEEYEEFQKQLGQLRKRLLMLESRIEQRWFSNGKGSNQ
jgi:hypothetical protein